MQKTHLRRGNHQIPCSSASPLHASPHPRTPPPSRVVVDGRIVVNRVAADARIAPTACVAVIRISATARVVVIRVADAARFAAAPVASTMDPSSNPYRGPHPPLPLSIFRLCSTACHCRSHARAHLLLAYCHCETLVEERKHGEGMKVLAEIYQY